MDVLREVSPLLAALLLLVQIGRAVWYLRSPDRRRKVPQNIVGWAKGNWIMVAAVAAACGVAHIAPRPNTPWMYPAAFAVLIVVGGFAQVFVSAPHAPPASAVPAARRIAPQTANGYRRRRR